MVLVVVVVLVGRCEGFEVSLSFLGSWAFWVVASFPEFGWMVGVVAVAVVPFSAQQKKSPLTQAYSSSSPST